MAKKGSVSIKIGGDASEYKKELTDSVKATEEAAKKIDGALTDAAKSLSDGLVEAYKEAQKEQEKAVKTIGGNVGKIASQNQEVINQKGKLGDVYDKLGDSAKTAGTKVKAGLADIKAGIDMASYAARKLADIAATGVNYNATIESLQTSFEVMTGSATKAAEVVERLRKLGAETPFEMADLAGTTQLLMQYGFTADDAIAKMSMLGDIAQGNAQAMTSIATGYAQMSSAGKVNLQDIKQMINAGFNPLQEISERTGESMASLYDRISKGSMKVDEITKSMQMATSEGGKFYQSMEKQSQTLNGQLSTLKDNADQLLGTLTKGMSEGLRNEFLPLANNMIGELQNAFEKGGIQGLSDAATDMIPNLLDMMSGEFEKGITAIGKWLPKGASSLMKHIPQALSSASAIIPQITTALFGVATVVVSDLAGMLPELLPALLEGFGSTFLAALDGIEGMIASLFSGVEKMFHQGQSKIAGIWVDDEQVAKYDLKIDVSADSDAAQENIAAAFNAIYDALNTDLLTKDQRDVIIDMIDEDYQTIYDKLISFSVPPDDAEVLAANITASADAVLKYLDDLNIGVDSKTLYKWMVQASDSRIALRQTLKKQGLSDADIEQVVAVFDTMNGRIKDRTPNIAEQIFAELTDGLTDDPEAMKAKVNAYLTAQDKAIDDAYNESLSKLDPTDSDYATKLATLNEDYASAKADLQTIGNDLNTLIDTLANASTATVQSKYQLLADVETQVNALSKRIEELSGEAMTLGQQAYNIVRSGAQADEDTISQAVSFKVSEFKLDEQAAEDAYAQVRDELNAKFNATEPDEKIRVDEYNELMSEAEAAKDAAIESAKKDFEKSFASMIQGIAESEGKSDSLARAMGLLGTKFKIDDFFAEIAESGGMISPEAATGLVESISEELGDALDMESITRAIELGDEYNFRSLLDEAITKAGLELELSENTKSAISGKVGASWKAALESGILSGTSFAVDDAEGQLAALYSAVDWEAAIPTTNTNAAGENLGEGIVDGAAQAVEDGKSDIAEAADGISESAMKLIEAATGNMSDYEGAKKAGEETALGLDIALAKAVRAARARGEEAGVAFAGGYKRTMMIKSPSKVMQNLGEHTGEGLNIGLRDSMKRAVATARLISGQIATAADISRDVRVNVPGLQQEIVGANQQTSTPVYLNGVQIAEIQGHNNSMQLAWQNTRAAKGVGSR